MALEIDVSVEDIQAMVLGGHGDTMVPLISYTSVLRNSGHAASSRRDRLDRDRGPHPQGWWRRSWRYLKTGSAYYAPSAGAVQMAEAIVQATRSAFCPVPRGSQGEYGMNDLYPRRSVQAGPQRTRRDH